MSKLNHFKRKITPYAVTISFVPAALVLFLIYRFAVNIPIADQWDIIYLFDRYYSSGLTLHDLWKQHNEHRILFPKIIFLINGVLSGYNVIYEMFISFGLAVLTYFTVLRHIDMNRKSMGWEKGCGWFPILFSVLFFSLTQHENWLWGFQLQWFLNIVGIVFGAFVLSNYPLKAGSVILLTLFGLLSTFSLSSGVLYWVVIFIFILLDHIKNQRATRRHIFLWICISSGVIALYLSDYVKPHGHPSLFIFLKKPVEFILYIFTYVGSPLSIEKTWASIIAGIVCVGAYFFYLYAYLSNRGRTDHTYPVFFFVIGLYGILSAILTAIGRAGFGHLQAMQSRYTTVSILVWVAVLFFLMIDLTRSAGKNNGKRSTYTKLVLVGVILTLSTLSSAYAIRHFYQTNEARNCGKLHLLTEKDAGCLTHIYPWPDRLLKNDVHRLKRLRISIFKDFIPSVNESINSEDWEIKGRWSINGIYPHNIPAAGSTESYKYGSWDGADANTGTIRSKPISIDAPMMVSLKFIHGPDIHNLEIGIEIVGSKTKKLLCQLNGDSHQWHECIFDLAPYQGQRFTVYSRDSGKGWGQWIGFIEPVITRMESL